jgi:hypothetical protein
VPGSGESGGLARGAMTTFGPRERRTTELELTVFRPRGTVTAVHAGGRIEHDEEERS